MIPAVGVCGVDRWISGRGRDVDVDIDVRADIGKHRPMLEPVNDI